MKCAMFSPTDSEGRSNNSVLTNLVNTKFCFTQLFPRTKSSINQGVGVLGFFGRIEGKKKLLLRFSDLSTNHGEMIQKLSKIKSIIELICVMCSRFDCKYFFIGCNY